MRVLLVLKCTRIAVKSMQQQFSTCHAAGQDSAAAFYARLVDIPAANLDAAAEWHARHIPGSAVAHDDWQQQHQQQPMTNAAPTAAAAAATPTPTPTAAAAHSMPFKPVKFAQPVVLDPNTGTVTLPPKSQSTAADSKAQAEAAAAPGPQPRMNSHPYPSRNSSSSRGGSSWFRRSAACDDPDSQARSYHSSSSSSNAAARQAAHPDAPSAFGANSKQAIARSNVGYMLLQKAGWQEGRGLGREEQGNTAPLHVQPQKGNRGLGFAPQQHHPQVAALTDRKSDQTAAAAPLGPVLGTKRVAALIADELAKEDLETKVKRHTQVLKQECEDIKGKAIQEFLRRAFNEPSMADIHSDSNPLQRSNRLRATNPLLDSDED